MNITADTNILVRILTRDDPALAERAETLLATAETIAIPTPVFCELVWVLKRGYAIPLPAIADTLRRLAATATVRTNRPAIDAGLALLQAGGDFADGVIAHEGAMLGGDTFVSFDQAALDLLRAQGHPTLSP